MAALKNHEGVDHPELLPFRPIGSWSVWMYRDGRDKAWARSVDPAVTALRDWQPAGHRPLELDRFGEVSVGLTDPDD
jgi:hypothetical protein